MSNLMQIEADFLTSAEVRSNVNFQSIFNLQSEVADAKKSKFDKSLKLAKLVHQSRRKPKNRYEVQKRMHKSREQWRGC